MRIARATAAAEHRGVEALQELRRREQPGLRGSELDRERQAVESRAQPVDGRSVVDLRTDLDHTFREELRGHLRRQ